MPQFYDHVADLAVDYFASFGAQAIEQLEVDRLAALADQDYDRAYWLTRVRLRTVRMNAAGTATFVTLPSYPALADDAFQEGWA